MTYTNPAELAPDKMDELVRRYVAVWSEPDPGRRRDAIAGLWAEDGAEFVESARFCGRDELDARVGGGVAWAARVVLLVGEDYLIRSDYQFTVVPLAAQ